MNPVAKVLSLAGALALGAVACAPHTQVSAVYARHHPRHPRLAIGAQGKAGATGSESRHSDGSSASEPKSTKGDRKAFAYASTDGAAIAAEVTSVLVPAGGGTVHYEGYELLDDAKRLENMASAARLRLKKVNPANATLVDARRDGISAYSLTEECANLMVNLAQADANDDLGALNAAANQALALEGRGEELAAYYTALITELESWSMSHPEAAAKAMKKYGG
jgi:hypothetical protein